MSALLTPLADGARLVVRVTPRARRSAVAGIVADADGRPMLALRLAAPPADGAANAALLAFLADALGLPRRAVRIESGETGRVKRIALSGDPAAIAGRLDALIAPIRGRGDASLMARRAEPI